MLAIYAPPAPVHGIARDPRVRRLRPGAVPSYVVCTYDVADDPSKDGDWTEVARASSLMALRPVFRRLMGRGYDTESIAVDRYDNPAP